MQDDALVYNYEIQSCKSARTEMGVGGGNLIPLTSPKWHFLLPLSRMGMDGFSDTGRLNR